MFLDEPVTRGILRADHLAQHPLGGLHLRRVERRTEHDRAARDTRQFVQKPLTLLRWDMLEGVAADDRRELTIAEGQRRAARPDYPRQAPMQVGNEDAPVRQ